MRRDLQCLWRVRLSEWMWRPEQWWWPVRTGCGGRWNCLAWAISIPQASAAAASSIQNAAHFLFVYSFYCFICLLHVGYLGEIYSQSNHCQVGFWHKLKGSPLHSQALRILYHLHVSYDGASRRKVKDVKKGNSRTVIDAVGAQVHLKCYFEVENVKRVKFWR